MITWDKDEPEFEKNIYELFPDQDVYFGTSRKDENSNFFCREQRPRVFLFGGKKLGTLI
ncbi:MAG: hypothetical protein Ct9H300mP20_18890 [Gammaproteobacteria bacterium]|nr:MAG: hypothetical protein Ct9H300mP20_18890 [Gammaproteobacteria bacterium]